MIQIHNIIYKKGGIAFFYYKKLGKSYTLIQAKKQFNQDKKIDLKVIRLVIKEAFEDQNLMLSKRNNLKGWISEEQNFKK